MSSQPFTTQQRTEALQNLGYTDREAAFLCLAALHGGYFLRRQYCAFIGKEVGGTASALAEKALSKGHATAISALNNTKIYHLGSRPFYALLGETDNRNRREHAGAAIKKRLMGLDFVLANPNNKYLATEGEKLDYFTETLGIAPQELPCRRYISRKTPSITDRYFVDKYPIFLSEPRPGQPRLTASFCYVDEGSITLSGFETYLQQYAPLWRRLSEFRVIFVADSRRLFEWAERRFTAFTGLLKRSELDPNALLAARLNRHFEARFRYENGDFSSFGREGLVRLRNETAEFSGTTYEDLYQRWKAAGPQVVTTPLTPQAHQVFSIDASFSIYFLDHSYSFLGKTEPEEFAVR